MLAEMGPILAEIRTASGLTQKQVAERMKANQTRVSRIEAGTGEHADIASYLEAVGTDAAADLSLLLAFEWVHLPQPSLRHPDLEVLMTIEKGLDRVRAFLADDQVTTVLAGQAELLERRLEVGGQAS